MYQPETILRLKQQRDPIEGPDGEELEFPYNRVIVIGASPVNHAGIQDEWVGGSADGIVIQPLSSFGANLDEPFGRLTELYEVESLPEEYPVNAQPVVKIVKPEQAGPSPEEVFAQETEKAGKDSRRVKPPKRKPSPLAPDVGPTDEEIAKKEAVKREALRRAGKLKESPLDESPTTSDEKG